MLDINARLTALLFVASEPVTAAKLANSLEEPLKIVADALDNLAASDLHGLAVTKHNDAYRLVSAPSAAYDVKRFLQSESRAELSRPAMETLAIIAYGGPVTKSDIDGIRGVASDTMLRNLIQRGLVIERGTSPAPTRQPLYVVTQTFLEQVGLTSLDALPKIDQAESL